MSKQMVEHVALYKDQPFVNCNCDPNKKTAYSIQHNPRPILLPQKLIDTLEMILWYSPNNRTSRQAFINDYLDNQLFENAVITYYLRFLEIKPEDICFVNGKGLPSDMVNPYQGKVCLSCQKIIVAKWNDETKISCILRHLRNCLAHGNFNLLSEEDFIGFDEINGNYSAVFKIKISQVNDFCHQIIRYPDFTVSHIFQYILMKANYTVLGSLTGAYNFRDMDVMEELIFAKKDCHAYRINCSRYRLNDSIDSIEIIDEYVIQYDNQFHKDVQYIDIYYCEKEKEVKKVAENKYIIGLSCLESLFEGHFELLESLG